jgi:hypothetical protein
LYPSGVINSILLYLSSLIASLAIKPKDFIPKADAKFKGPELFPTKKLEFLIAVITPDKSF